MSEFDNINGIYAKDATLREGIATLRNTVVSQTIKSLTVTQNGTYTANPSEGTYGYSPITVDVQEQPWAPLEDGYSNFWFELTNDTLSPWLNFSAKEADAVIDWGDGSGEQLLDTLTPTHTYARAGKYVVKCRGVTGIGLQFSPPYLGEYFGALQYVELNSDVTLIAPTSFRNSIALKRVVCSENLVTLNYNCFVNCSALQTFDFADSITALQNGLFSSCVSLVSVSLPPNLEILNPNVFNVCYSLRTITLPSTVTSIGNTCFNGCYSLGEIHVQATTPPTLGTTVFNNLPSTYIIYVPVGTGDTYKAATGWSDYADHILEEGQTPNRAMLSRLAKATVSDDAEEMR